jgi:hypothetical protein
MKERVLVESKIKEKTLPRLEITKQLLGLLGDHKYPIKDLSKIKSKSVNYSW